ncbi:hypothetical protein DPMN_167366 [Dreissena polymorpha]|uniref:Uncharacterized protein n=1 Tax=Dreissena polymorpha TaxID=45954 RepID=A0A9D4F0R4_DREPO|nr:hypothetical protein DPMN_167366 [Dreissena polymorpha]
MKSQREKNIIEGAVSVEEGHSMSRFFQMVTQTVVYDNRFAANINQYSGICLRLYGVSTAKTFHINEHSRACGQAGVSIPGNCLSEGLSAHWGDNLRAWACQL